MCKLEWTRALLTMALISGADVSMPAFEPQEDILNIHRDINKPTVSNDVKINSKTIHLLQIFGSFLTFTFHKVV